MQEYLFEAGETVVFRGTDDLKFNFLRITKNVKADVTPRTKIRGNLLLEHEIKHNGSVLFYEDPAIKGSSMALAQILCDKDKNIVTITLTEINNLNETLLQMDKETYGEIVSISEVFENSLKNEKQKVSEKRVQPQTFLMRKMKRIEMKRYSTKKRKRKGK